MATPRIITSPFPLPALPEKNTFDFLFKNPLLPPVPDDHVSYINGLTGLKRTRGEHLDLVRRTATALVASVDEGGLGMGAGEMVGLYSSNNAEYAVLAHALLYLTIPFILLNTSATTSELLHSVKLSKPTRIFVHSDLLSRAIAVSKDSQGVIGVDRLYPIDITRDGFLDLGSLLHRTRNLNVTPVRPAGRDTLAYLIFSSGTSGLPKAVMISHSNINASLFQSLVLIKAQRLFAEAQAPSSGASLPAPPAPMISLATLPFYHSFGLHVFVLRTHLAPATAVILPKWSASSTIRAITKYRITHLPLVPSMIHQIVNHRALTTTTTPRADFSSIIHLASGAAHLSPELASRAKHVFSSAHNIPNPTDATKTRQPMAFSQGYGLSESTLSVLAYPFRPATRPPKGVDVSSGMILSPGMDAVIVSESDAGTTIVDGVKAKITIINDDAPGELWIRGANIGLGYWMNDDATRETFGCDLSAVGCGQGWMRTGDRFRVDQDGYFYFEDRLKDILKVSGVQVSPTEIEETIFTHCQSVVADVCVAGVTPPRSSSFAAKAEDETEKVPRAWIVLTPHGHSLGHAASAKEVEKCVRERLSRFKWLTGGIEFLDEVPKGPTGKALRRALQERYERGRSGGAGAKL